MTRRGAMVVVIVLGVLVLAVGVLARATAGANTVGSAPEGSPSALPAQGAGSAVVELSADALRHPSGEAVRSQLQRHFDAINARDYPAWSETVAPDRSDALPEKAWQKAYATTRDGSVRIDRIDDVAGGGLLVRVRFVSTQDLADAPEGARAERVCWHNTLPMDGTPPRIGSTRGGSSVPAAC